jgi:glycosyltransferase involved in cell wall biosynthesis
MRQPMKILVLCYEYPPLGGGGGRVAQTISRKLRLRGHDVQVITGGMPRLPEVSDEDGVQVRRVRSGRRREDRCSMPEMMAWCVAAFPTVAREVRGWRPNVIHAHFAMPTGLLAWAIHRLAAVPYVITAHLGDVPGAFFPRDSALFVALHPIASRIWREAAAVTGVSSFVATEGAASYGCSVLTVLNGVEIPPSGNAGASAQARTPKLLFTGRLVDQKRPVLLLEILAKLSALPWSLTIIGDGPLMPSVQDRVRSLQLSDRVSIRGWLETEAVQQELRDADIFCMPSTSEGLPVAAVEALSHGLAIVGSDIPGLRDVLHDGVNGRAIAPEDTQGFISALGQILSTPALLARMRSESLKMASNFNLEHITVQYEQVLTAAATASSCTP